MSDRITGLVQRGKAGRVHEVMVDVMPFEDGVGVITEPRLERSHFGLVNVIQSQLINVARPFRIRTTQCLTQSITAAPQKNAKG